MNREPEERLLLVDEPDGLFQEAEAGIARVDPKVADHVLDEREIRKIVALYHHIEDRALRLGDIHGKLLEDKDIEYCGHVAEISLHGNGRVTLMGEHTPYMEATEYCSYDFPVKILWVTGWEQAAQAEVQALHDRRKLEASIAAQVEADRIEAQQRDRDEATLRELAQKLGKVIVDTE